jgi:hypothetical protein
VLLVFDQASKCSVQVGNHLDQSRDGRPAEELGGAKAALAGDELEPLGRGANDNGLEQPYLLHRIGQLAQAGFIEGLSDLEGGRVDSIDGDYLELGSDRV